MPKAKVKSSGASVAKSTNDGWLSKSNPSRKVKKVSVPRRSSAWRVSPKKGKEGSSKGLGGTTRKWDVSPTKTDSPEKRRQPVAKSPEKTDGEKRVTFKIEREEGIPVQIFSDLVRVGGGLGLRGELVPINRDVPERKFTVVLEGSAEALNTYWSYIQIAAVVIGEISDLSCEEADPPVLDENKELGNFVVYRVAQTAPKEEDTQTALKEEDAASGHGEEKPMEADDYSWDMTETLGIAGENDDNAQSQSLDADYELSQSILSRR